jgi:fused signal recognition particle receptor
MQNTESANTVVDTLSMVDRLVEFLGFHDLTSFVIAMIFILAAIAFVVSGAIFLVKKRRERLAELNKIVTEIQAEHKSLGVTEPERASPKEMLKTATLEEKISQVRAKPLVAEKIAPPPSPKFEKVKRPVAPKTEIKPPEKIKVPAVAAPKPIEAKKAVVEPKGEIEPPALKIEVPEPKPMVVEKKALGAALKNTRGGFMHRLARLFSSTHEISDEDFEAMEAILFSADIGVKTAQKLLDNVKARVAEQKSTDRAFLRQALKEEMRKIFASANPIAAHDAEAPKVVMFVGVNGAGKTTSIGKMGAQLKNQGKAVYFGAGDTFRAAAVKQLSLWGERVGAPVISGKENSDSASVLFDAIDQAKKAHADVVLCDTAGRLHTKSDLMDELKKVHRVVNKAHAGAPHEVFLVIDATMGQNAIMQAREFALATPLTGVVLSKLDGTAKGGVALGIVDELKVPIRFVGIGEQVDDLKEFDADQFIDALFDETNE